MALHLNLLHEEITEQRQRQRDPLKIGMIALAGFGALLFLFYGFNAYRTLAIKSKFNAVNREWSKIEPSVTAAKKRADELNAIVKSTRALDEYIDSRFFWAPFLQKMARCVAPNAQLTNISGSVQDDGKTISVSIEGVAAGREARAAAEDLRQMLTEQLSQSYSEVKVEFKSLEDLDNMVNIGGSSMALARYNLSINFVATPPAKPSGSPNSSQNPKR